VMKHCATIARNASLWMIVLTTVLFAVHPLPAASQASELDLERIDAYISGQVRRHGIPGLALGIVEGNQIVYLKGYGKADQNGRAITPQTPFLLASVSKPLTALAIMQLVEAGKVELDAPVQRYVPDFRVADLVASAEITVRHLLLHTSGIPSTACDTRIDAETLEQYVAELQTIELDAPVGTHHNYCSGNYNLLGRIIETVSGQSFGSYMQQHVFDPLEMHHSFTSEQEAMQDGMAQGYQWLFGLVVPTHYRYNPSQLPSGFLISSAEDMSHLLISQLNGGRFDSTTILSPEGIAAMQVSGVRREDGSGYGFGWEIGSVGGIPSVSHAGANYNYHSLLLMQPETGRGAVLLMNSFGAVASVSAYKDIEEGVARLLAKQALPPPSLSLHTLYLLVDLPLALLFIAALWPLLHLRHWGRLQQQRQREGRLQLVLVGLRLVWEIGLPLTLLIATRLALHRMGAQSWLEGLFLFPDFGAWLWALSLIMLLTGAIRLVLIRRILRRDGKQEISPSVAITGQHVT
jgi:CubicO group peptidase (beta-lactamase class C family)